MREYYMLEKFERVFFCCPNCKTPFEGKFKNFLKQHKECLGQFKKGCSKKMIARNVKRGTPAAPSGMCQEEQLELLVQIVKSQQDDIDRLKERITSLESRKVEEEEDILDKSGIKIPPYPELLQKDKSMYIDLLNCTMDELLQPDPVVKAVREVKIAAVSEERLRNRKKRAAAMQRVDIDADEPKKKCKKAVSIMPPPKALPQKKVHKSVMPNLALSRAYIEAEFGKPLMCSTPNIIQAKPKSPPTSEFGYTNKEMEEMMVEMFGEYA